MVKFNNSVNVENINPQNSFLNATTNASARQSVRRTNPELLLQKNFSFERCLWEENSRSSFIPVTSRQATAMHLSPVQNTARLILLNDVIRGQKQFLFNLNDFVESIDSSLKVLSLEEVGLGISEVVSQQQVNVSTKAIAASLYATPMSDFIGSEKLTNLNTLLTSQLLRAYILLLSGEQENADFVLGKIKSVILLTSSKINQRANKKYGYMTVFRRKLIEGVFSGGVTTRNPVVLRFVVSRMFGRVLASPNLLKQTIWKRSILPLENTAALSRMQHGYFYSAHRFTARNPSMSFYYFLRRIEDKYQILVQQNNAELAERLLQARNYLLALSEERLHRQRQKTLVLARSNWVRVIRRRGWRNLFAEVLLRRAERDTNGRQVVELLTSTIAPHILSGSHNVNRKVSLDVGTSDQSSTGQIIPDYTNWRRVLRPQRQSFVNKKIVEVESDYTLKGYTDLFSQITGREASVFFVNALSLTRFAFQGEGKGKSSQRFLQNIDREMVSRYKYVAVYIQDFVRVSFISLFLKKPTFLAQFMALQISKLPRNRKETKMLRFLIKVVKIFAAQRREVVGLRVLFKGRVNRWRRTKQVIGEKGILPLQSLSSRIEFGFAKAVTRKGTLGIRIWICYNPVFRRELRNAFLDYFDYSQQLRSRSLHRFLANFQPR